MHGAAMFIFLAAGAVGLFAFLSVAAWAGTQAHERRTRDRFALLKSIAEQPGENAQRVLEALLADEERVRTEKARQEQWGYLVGGLVCMAVGVALGAMMLAMNAKSGAWSIGLIPFLLGAVLTVVSRKIRA